MTAEQIISHRDTARPKTQADSRRECAEAANKNSHRPGAGMPPCALKRKSGGKG